MASPLVSPQSTYFDAPLLPYSSISTSVGVNSSPRHNVEQRYSLLDFEPSFEIIPAQNVDTSRQLHKSHFRRDSGTARTTSIQSFNDNATNKSGTGRELTMEEEIMSVKVRGLYGSGINSGDPLHPVFLPRPSSTTTHHDDKRISMISGLSGKTGHLTMDQPGNRHSIGMTIASSTLSMDENGSIKEMEPRSDHELAGGVEDWQDVESAEIDRYGFIVSEPEAVNPKPRGHQRTSTALLLKSSEPRKEHRHKLQALIVPVHEESSMNMLTSPPAHANERMKDREFKRIQKWRNMAKKDNPNLSSNLGGGTVFDFDIRDSKLISRTWKGIPDCWRATAWHSFLSASAKQRGNCLSDRQLISTYHNLLSQNNAEDAQIDLDVPRTISSHIMFRRRYRGGQRLLFRVLHAFSLHIPEIGYVQGMASLAATFLCYYDEDMAFVMMVRLFELRGLDRLYQPGFDGLMNALYDFQTTWMHGTAVGKRLDQLNVPIISYGTRWYLTLFNNSIPFAAQLRIWDIFMLLGDRETSNLTPASDSAFASSLDILHAASSALIEGMKDVLLKCDFEDAMKVLTGWIPIKDEDVLMRVMKAEWRKRKRWNPLSLRSRA